MAPEIPVEVIGGRIQMLADRHHGRGRRRTRRQHLIIEGARMYVRALEHAQKNGSTDLAPREYIAALAAMIVADGKMDLEVERALSYMTAACDEDPGLIVRIVSEDPAEWKMFSLFCQSIQHILTYHASRGGYDPLLAFMEVSQ